MRFAVSGSRHALEHVVSETGSQINYTKVLSHSQEKPQESLGF
jgi:hypothetical protein